MICGPTRGATDLRRHNIDLPIGKKAILDRAGRPGHTPEQPLPVLARSDRPTNAENMRGDLFVPGIEQVDFCIRQVVPKDLRIGEDNGGIMPAIAPIHRQTPSHRRCRSV